MSSNIADKFESLSIDEEFIINKEYFEQMKDSLCCTICCGVILNPKMCSVCETPYCDKCIENWNAKQKSCPMRCQNSQIKDINRALSKIFDALKIKCKYGCETTCLEFIKHTKICEEAHTSTNCWNCGKECKVSQLKFKQNTFEEMKKENQELKNQVESLSKILEGPKFNNPNMSLIQVGSNSLLLDAGLKLLMESWISPDLQFQLLYKGSVNDFKATTFHALCDNKGPTVVVMKTNHDKIIGGFTTLNWVSPQNSGIFFKDQTSKTFVFSYTLKKKYDIRGVDKLAICCNKNYGPIFGNYDLLTVDQSNIYNCGNFDIGTSFNYDGDKNSFYGNTPYFLKDIEVYLVSKNR